MELGLLEDCGVVPRLRLRGIRVVFFGDYVGHKVLPLMVRLWKVSPSLREASV